MHRNRLHKERITSTKNACTTNNYDLTSLLREVEKASNPDVKRAIEVGMGMLEIVGDIEIEERLV